jgi:hypothetical protein
VLCMVCCFGCEKAVGWDFARDWSLSMVFFWAVRRLLLNTMLFEREEYKRSVLRITDLYEGWISSDQAGQICLDQSVRSCKSRHLAAGLRCVIA